MVDMSCRYHEQWIDEAGYIPVCILHGQNSKHEVKEGANPPCLEIDPYEETE